MEEIEYGLMGRKLEDAIMKNWIPKIPYFASLSSMNVVTIEQDCDILILLISAYAMAKLKAKWFMKCNVNRYAVIKTIHDFFGDKVSQIC